MMWCIELRCSGRRLHVGCSFWHGSRYYKEPCFLHDC